MIPLRLGQQVDVSKALDLLTMFKEAGKLADKTQMAGRFGLPFSLKISNFAQILAYGKER